MAETQTPQRDTEAMAVIDRQKQVRAFLDHKDVALEIQKALPEGLKFERMMRVIATAVSENPKLALCTRRSLLGTVIQCAQLGLELGGYLGHAYPIPYRNSKASRELGRDVYDCTLQLGYRGLVELAYRSGKVLSIAAEVVGRDDKFHVTMGSDARIVHEPNLESSDRDLMGEPVEVVAAYAIVKLRGGGEVFRVVTGKQLEALQIEAKRKAGGRNDGPWFTHFNEMCRKTPVRRMAKMLPLSPEFTEAAVMDEYHETGVTHSQVIDMQLPPGAPELDEPVVEPEAEPEAAADGAVQEVEKSAETGEAERLFKSDGPPKGEKKTVHIRYEKGQAYCSGATFLVKEHLKTRFKAKFLVASGEWKLAQEKTPEFIEMCEKVGIAVEGHA